MKQTILIAGFLISYTLMHAQTKSCCSPATESFAALNTDINFVNKHDDPVPFNYVSDAGEMISFKTPDGKDANAFFIKAKEKTNNYLFVFHEWWGLNDYIKQVSEKLYNDLGNINVIALDLYDEKIATTKDEAGAMMQSLSPERAKTIIESAIKYAGNDADIATIGWCMGGGWSLQAALIAESHASACVMYYGMPETDVERLKNLNADVLFMHAMQDKWINADVVGAFEKNMQAADKKLIVHHYDADHAFANPSNPKFNKEFTEDAYEKSIAFLRQRLK